MMELIARNCKEEVAVPPKVTAVARRFEPEIVTGVPPAGEGPLKS